METVGRWLLRIAVLAGLIFGGQQLIGLVADWLDMSLMPHTEEMLHRAIIVGTVIFIVLMAIPFVPGAEIGLTLLTVLGGAIAPLVYLATVTSFMIAFLIGRLLPPTVLQKGLAGLGLHRGAQFVAEAAAMTDEDLEHRISEVKGPKFLRVMLRYRYVALALAINTPGNVVFGGGGGLALMAGLSRLFDPVAFLLTVLLAVLPIPLLFYIGHFSG